VAGICARTGWRDADRQGNYEVAHSTGVYVFDADGRARLLFRPTDMVDAMRADLLRLVR
jgi:protein SCO1/2